MLTILLPFLREKASYILFPLQVPLSQMETIANIWPAHEEDITSLRFLWSVWFGSAERVCVPQSPIHACEPAPSCLGKAKLDQNDALGFWHLDLLSSPSLPKRASHISETSRSLSSSRRNLQLIMPHRLLLMQDQLFSGAGYGTVFGFGRLTWLSYASIHGGNGEDQSFGRTSLFAGDEHTTSQDIWQKSHSLLGTISSSFSHLHYGKSGCLLKGMGGVIFWALLNLDRLFPLLLCHRVATLTDWKLEVRILMGEMAPKWRGYPPTNMADGLGALIL